jgi:hypothetical protein
MVFKVDCANQNRLSTPVPSRIHSRRLEATTTCPAAFALMLGESAVASCGPPFSGGLSGYVQILLQKSFSTVIKIFLGR